MSYLGSWRDQAIQMLLDAGYEYAGFSEREIAALAKEIARLERSGWDLYGLEEAWTQQAEQVLEEQQSVNKRSVVKVERPPRNPNHSEKYDRYINSPKWEKKRQQAIKRSSQGHCERCGICASKAGVLDVHHLTYERLGHELLSDLKVVCRACHKIEDAERARRTEERALWRYYGR